MTHIFKKPSPATISTTDTPKNTVGEINWLDSSSQTKGQAAMRNRETNLAHHRVYEPGRRMNTIDPISGEHIADLANQPSFRNGHLTIYFKSEDTRWVYMAMPVGRDNTH